MIWKKLSTIAIWSAGILAIVDSFMGKYIPNHALIFLIAVGVALLLFVASEVMKFINKSRTK